MYFEALNKVRKAKDMEYEIQGYYGKRWEVETTEETRAEALKRLKEYQENVPQFRYRIKLVK